mmetsp:Transcript_1704/g.5147  ORF Transcript_1704/g.5147 Transcript_1704/m.5147 type:complete len:333 (+) Transcript_1704:178-1176(+)|eukprot:CAMPEP_0198723684 /NCGR_PEP_ID=MMETSP1475-20131203/1206_1 /TAXON_ID= ORGANISM="Unidentified sp., Strain CCMP1999" /NCGR_SAMPLE_ID=MMETSP1475 /ASSEMBLY_ACC=CAM_ASM_001111 /LENGTH=332 /DNA_ID=CAMNT_0044484937 /DNA_START=163 /DNA_END=1161 /DNA_ORIENTATION=-
MAAFVGTVCIRRQNLKVSATADPLSRRESAGNAVPKRVAGSSALTAATMMWAASNAIQRQLILGGLNPSVVTAARFGGTGLLFLPQFKKALFLPGLKLAALSFLGNATLASALKFTSAARAGFFCSMSVVLTPLVASIVRRRRPQGKDIIASIISAFGVYLLMKEDLAVAASSPFGDALSLLAAFLFASYTVKLGLDAPKYDTRKLTAALRVCNGVMSFTWASTEALLRFSSGASLFGAIAISKSTILLGIGLLTAMLAFSGLLQVYGQKRLSPPESALIFSLVPVWTAIIAFIQLGETMSRIAMVGGAFLIGGCLFGQLGGLLWERKSAQS